MRKLKKVLISLFFVLISYYAYGNDIVIYKIDARSLSFSEKNLIQCISGIVNRKSSDKGVFVVLSDYDSVWIKDIKEAGYTIVELTKDELIEEFKNYLKGQVLFDGSNDYTRNIAATIAGINDAFITEEQISGFSVIYDCRNKWNSKIEAYNWAINNLLNKANLRIAADLSYTAVNLLDFIIAHKLFVFDLDPLNNSDEINLINEILSHYATTTPVIGWPDGRYADESLGQNNVDVENAFMNLINTYGLCLTPSDYAGNLSLFKKLSGNNLLLQYRIKKEYDSSKKYVTFIFSDGDNLQYVVNYMRSKLWEDPARINIPLGWTFSPMLFEWGKFIVNKFYDDAMISKNDEFTAPASGFTYIQPNSFNGIGDFLNKTKDMVLNMDEWHCTIIDSTSDASARRNMYKNYASLTYLNTLFLEAEVGIREIIKNNSNGILTLSQDIRGTSVNQLISDIRSQIASGKNMIYVYVHSWDVTPTDIQKVIDGLSDINLEVVMPSTFSDLWLQKHIQSVNNIGSISGVIGEWDETTYDKCIYKVSINKSSLPVSFDTILSAKVVYYFQNSSTKYFQYLRENSDTVSANMLVPDEYRYKKIYYYFEFITSDSNLYKTSTYPSYNLNDYSGPKISAIVPVDGKGEIYNNQWFNFSGSFKWDEGNPNNVKIDTNLLVEESGSDTNEIGLWSGGRFGDGNNYFIYKLCGVPGNYYKLDLRIGNNFKVGISQDLNGNYEEVLNSENIFGDDIHNLSNLMYQTMVISKYIKNGDGTIYVKIMDNSPGDSGWGGKCGALYMRKIPAYKDGDTIKFYVYTDSGNHIVKADFSVIGGSIVYSRNNGMYTNIFPIEFTISSLSGYTNGIYNIPVTIFNAHYSPSTYFSKYIIRIYNNEEEIESNELYVSASGFSLNSASVNNKIKFYAPQNYSSKIVVSIFSLDGRLINSIKAINQFENNRLYVEWDGTDRNGKKENTGVYIFKIESGEFIKKGIISIVK